jgi:hypothetical protein
MGVTARAVLGAVVGDRLRDALPDSLSFVAKEAGSKAERLLRVELKLAASRSSERELQLICDLDLSRSNAAKAYDRALRGDWRAMSGSGVSWVLRSVGHERQRHFSAKLGVSKLASFHRSVTTTRAQTTIADREGVRVENLGRVERGKGHSWLGRNEKHRLSIEGLWTTRAGVRNLSIRVHYSARDERTSAEEFYRMRGALVACGFGQAFTQKQQGKKAKCELDVVVSPLGLRAVSSASREDVLRAYALAVQVTEGQRQLWIDPARREVIRWAKTASVGSTHSRPKYPEQLFHILRAEKFADTLAAMGRARTQADREDQLIKLARKSRWELYEVGALVRLSGWSKHAKISGSLDGKRYGAE